MKRFWPFRHFGLKLWSVAIAAMLWLVVAGEQTVERGLRVPLELQQFPAGLELGVDAPSLIDVRVRGSAGTLSRIAQGDVVAVLDLRTARAGKRLFQLSTEQIRVPYGIQVVQVTPQSIGLSFENSATREVPVVPPLEGSPAAGYRVGRVTVDPPTVEVVGPESAIERVTEATTEPVSVAEASHDVTDTVIVGFVDPALRLKSPRAATVNVAIVVGPPEQKLERRSIVLKSTPKGLAATTIPPAVDVILAGGENALGGIDAAALTPWVDLSSLGPGEYTLTVHVDPPAPSGVVRLSPPTVQVRIRSDK